MCWVNYLFEGGGFGQEGFQGGRLGGGHWRVAISGFGEGIARRGFEQRCRQGFIGGSEIAPKQTGMR